MEGSPCREELYHPVPGWSWWPPLCLPGKCWGDCSAINRHICCCRRDDSAAAQASAPIRLLQAELLCLESPVGTHPVFHPQCLGLFRPSIRK